MSLEKEPAGAFNKAQRLIECPMTYALSPEIARAKPNGWRPRLFPTFLEQGGAPEFEKPTNLPGCLYIAGNRASLDA
jgi:hypothetical protein